MKKKTERDKKGQYAKGHKGGPGRPKGEPEDIIYKDGKKRTIAALLNDLLGTYEKLGSDKFLTAWAKQSHKNLNEFMKLLFRFVPEPKSIESSDRIPLQVIVSDKYLPKDAKAMKMPRPGDKNNMEKIIYDLQVELKRRGEEIRRLKDIFDAHGIKSEEIEHEPIPPDALPEHKEEKEQPENQEKNNTAKKEKVHDLNDDDDDDENKPGWVQDLEDDLN